MEPKDHKRPCPNGCNNTKEEIEIEVVPIIHITRQFGKNRFEYPEFFCLKCLTEFFDTTLLRALINEYTNSTPLQKRMMTEIRNDAKKSARACGRKMIFVHRLTKRTPTI